MLSLAEAQKAYNQASSHLKETQGVKFYLYRELDKAKKRLNRAIMLFRIVKSILPTESCLYCIAIDNIEQKKGVLKHLQEQLPFALSEFDKALDNKINANFDLLVAQYAK